MLDLLRPAFHVVPTYITGLVSLVSKPKRYIGERNKTPENVNGAFALYLASVLIGFFLEPSLFLDEGKWGMSHAIGVSLTLATLGIMLHAWVIKMSWSIVGRKVLFLESLTTSCYIGSIGVLIIAITNSMAYGAALASDADAVQRLVQLVPKILSYQAGIDEKKEFVELVQEPSMIALSGIAFIGWLLHFTWEVVCWGAFRRLCSASRIRSCAAFVLSCAITYCVGIARILLTSSTMGWYTL